MLSSVQARAQRTPRARFVAHASLSISLLASDEIDRLYSQLYLPVIQIFFRRVTALEKNCIHKNSARKRAYARDHQRASDLLIERSCIFKCKAESYTK